MVASKIDEGDGNGQDKDMRMIMIIMIDEGVGEMHTASVRNSH